MKLLIALIIALPLMVFADHHEEGGKGKSFSERKAHAVKKVDERISRLQEHKSCIQGAADKKAMKACRDKQKEYRKEMKHKRKEMRGKRKEMREKRRKARQTQDDE